MKTLTYRQLSAAAQEETFVNWEVICLKHGYYDPEETFESYHEEQLLLDLNFDAETLECLG